MTEITGWFALAAIAAFVGILVRDRVTDEYARRYGYDALYAVSKRSWSVLRMIWRLYGRG
jgi:hypothetical protein